MTQSGGWVRVDLLPYPIGSEHQPSPESRAGLCPDHPYSCGTFGNATRVGEFLQSPASYRESRFGTLNFEGDLGFSL